MGKYILLLLLIISYSFNSFSQYYTIEAFQSEYVEIEDFESLFYEFDEFIDEEKLSFNKRRSNKSRSSYCFTSSLRSKYSIDISGW
jgi:hypothetical protein